MSSSRIVVETGVDKLMNFLKKNPPTSIDKIAKALNTTPKIIESWAEFLIEERVIGIEYRLTTPYLFVIEKQTKTNENNKFKKKIYEEIDDLSERKYNWKDYILEVVENHKNFFYKEAKKRRLKEIDALWETYKDKVVKL